jgi:hypothetical protein
VLAPINLAWSAFLLVVLGNNDPATKDGVSCLHPTSP